MVVQRCLATFRKVKKQFANGQRARHHGGTLFHKGVPMLKHRLLTAISLLLLAGSVSAAELPIVTGIESQPVKAQAERVVAALEFLGQPLNAEQRTQLDQALAATGNEAVEAIQKVFD